MNNNITIRPFQPANFEPVYELVHQVIAQVYPRYYPMHVVDFFHEHHNRQHMQQDIPNGETVLLYVDDTLAGTGSIVHNEIKRMLLLPAFHGKGLGSRLLKTLENSSTAAPHDILHLHSTLAAFPFYIKHGYEQTSFVSDDIGRHEFLCYFNMRKYMNRGFAFNYNCKKFIGLQNSESGQVNDETIFTYHQHGSTLWGEYSGGQIEKGFLTGTVEKDGRLQFAYQHMDESGELRTGICHSVPTIDEDGKIILQESWQWANGDCSRGESLLQEIT